MKRTIVTVTLLVLACVAFGAAPTLITLPNNLVFVEIKPMAVPTSSTAACDSTIWLDSITFTNTTAGSLTVTVADQQGSPITVLAAVAVPANSFTVAKVWSYRMEGGFKWTASGAGVNGFFNGRVQR